MSATTFTDFLRARRAECNARFVAARRRWPRLDAGDFSLFLRDQFSPLAGALETHNVCAVLDPAYEIGLQLVAEKIAGPSATTSTINELWTKVFPFLTTHIASAPRRVIASLCNAAHHLATTPNNRADVWQHRLVELAPHCENVDQLLTIAKVLAWRAGMAQYRATALTAADFLPPSLALALLEAPADANWPDVRAAHAIDPWFGFAIPVRSHFRLGMFRGFGGLFLTPPLVTRTGSELLVRSSDEAWILIADAFGATFHRASQEEIKAAASVSVPRDVSLLPHGHTATSGVILGHTHAFTSAQSHSIWIGPVRTVS